MEEKTEQKNIKEAKKELEKKDKGDMVEPTEKTLKPLDTEEPEETEETGETEEPLEAPQFKTDGKSICFSVKATNWNKFIKSVSVLVESGTLNFVKEGMYIRAMDAGQVALVDLKVPNTELGGYVYDKDTPTSINIDFKKYEEQTRRMSKTISVKVERNRIVSKVVDGDTVSEFVINALGTTADASPKIPNISWDNIIPFDKAFITKAIGDIDLFGEKEKNTHITFLSMEDKENNGKRLLLIGEDSLGKVVISKKEELKTELKNTSFNSSILKSALKACDEGFKAYLKTDTPIKVEYNIGGAGVSYIIAPLIID